MSTATTLGKAAPTFKAQATNDQAIDLAKLKGQAVLLYFYPRDNTPGCTQQGEDLRDHFAEFAKFNCVILGVSRDSLASHEKFKAKFNFPFELISDPDESVCQLYDVMRDKNMYGKKVRGIERSTFLIDSNGILRHEWRKVKVPGHVPEVLAKLTEMQDER